jgi:hypothetical protein
MGDLEDEPRIDETVTGDEAVLLLALAGRAEAVVLTVGGLADPAGRTKARDFASRRWAAPSSERSAKRTLGWP